MKRTSERKEREKENRKNDILKAAENIMKKNGLHGLNVDQIAEDTSLAKGTIYLYFKSKEEILGNLTVKARKLLLKEFVKIDKMDLNPIDKLREIIIANYKFYRKNTLYYDLVSLYEANHTLEETDEMYGSSNAITELVSKIAFEAKEKGELNENLDPLHFTMILWGTTVGILQMLKVRGALIESKLNITENQILDSFLELFFQGVKKK
ncbi:TetR/AcrR family transcriptional regulator [Aquiflexum lacus]|uniref:TetR/AcrR family transcriptional regulator n=1 Tax=Aquiflexum lacus TaxID=2483805 RepID=UPI001894F147|nr:TetR/AcrR family transcriptional regulator [Aquiflexum lacus]